MTDEFDFSGSQGATVAQESRKGGDFAREIEYLRLDASPAGKAQGKDRIILRFLTDSHNRHPEQPMSKYNLAWLTIADHYAPTKPKPEYVNKDANWPQKMSATCRKDPVFAAKYGGACFLCDTVKNKPSKRTWALAVEREEVRNEQGQILGYRDKTREVFATDEKGDLIVVGTDSEGKKEYQRKTVPAYIVMSMGWKNFFQPLEGQASYFNSLLDADWLITRTGTKNDDTSYAPIRVAEQVLSDDNPWGLAAGTKYDLSIPGLMEKVYPDMPDLRKIITDRVNDDYYGRFFIPGWTPEGFQAGQQQGGQQATQTGQAFMASAPSAPAAPTPPQGEAPTADALAALQARVTGR